MSRSLTVQKFRCPEVQMSGCPNVQKSRCPDVQMTRCMNLLLACALLDRQPLLCVCVCARMKQSGQFCLIYGPKYFETCPHFWLPNLISKQRLFLIHRRNITKPQERGNKKIKCQHSFQVRRNNPTSELA